MQKWFIHIYNVVDCSVQLNSFVFSECPIEPSLSNINSINIEMKISTLDNFVFLLESSDNWSAIWTLFLPTMKWYYFKLNIKFKR